jgi:hypothetical protein
MEAGGRSRRRLLKGRRLGLGTGSSYSRARAHAHAIDCGFPQIGLGELLPRRASLSPGGAGWLLLAHTAARQALEVTDGHDEANDEDPKPNPEGQAPRPAFRESCSLARSRRGDSLRIHNRHTRPGQTWWPGARARGNFCVAPRLALALESN